MAFVHNPNSGALFKNDRKEKPSQPDYKGTINVEGQEFWISGWIKQASTGKTYMSLAVNPKEDAPMQKTGDDKDFDNDIPF